VGIELLLAWAALANDRKPDWPGAERVIDNLELNTVWQEEYEVLFPWEDWLRDVPNPPDPVGTGVAVRCVQHQLLQDLRLVRDAIGANWHRELAKIDLPTTRIYVTGGLSGGEVSTGLQNPLARLSLAGALRGAGFFASVEDEG